MVDRNDLPAEGSGARDSGNAFPASGDAGNSGATPAASGSARQDGAREDLLSIVSPETAEAERSASWKYKRLAFLAVGTLLTATSGFYAGAKMDLIFTQERAIEEDEAADAVDDKKPPFNWKVTPALNKNEGWSSFHLTRHLTPEERSKLTATRGDGEDIWNIVRPWGGRRVGGRADGYLVQFTSERAKPVSITKLSAKPTQCRKSEVKTVIFTDGAGAIEWGDIHFYFNGDAKDGKAVPATEKVPPGASLEDPPQWNSVISLGNGESPGYFRLWPQSKLTCEWILTAEYNVNSGKTRQASIDEDEYGEKLLTIGENPQDGIDYMGPNEFGTGS
ncbi:hypothetical protein ACFY7B_26175 [Streptomyces albidoflavus]